MMLKPMPLVKSSSEPQFLYESVAQKAQSQCELCILIILCQILSFPHTESLMKQRYPPPRQKPGIILGLSFVSTSISNTWPTFMVSALLPSFYVIIL